MRLGMHDTHPAADAFRMMNDEEFALLCDSIRKTGLRDPIIIDKDELIVDGRNRYRACLEVGSLVKFKTTSLEGEALIEFVASTNRDRKQMTPGELAAAGALLVPQFAELAKERQLAGKALGSDEPKGTAASQAADVVGSSPASVKRALRVQQESEDAFAALKAGETSIAQATRNAGISSKPVVRVFDAYRAAKEIVDALTLAEGKIRAYAHDLRKNPEVNPQGYAHIQDLMETLENAFEKLP